MFVVSVLLTVASAILGLPQPLLLGILGGLLEFLPSVGCNLVDHRQHPGADRGSSTLPVSNSCSSSLWSAFIAYTSST